jgi:serine/threonine protein kinase
MYQNKYNKYYSKNCGIIHGGENNSIDGVGIDLPTIVKKREKIYDNFNEYMSSYSSGRSQRSSISSSNSDSSLRHFMLLDSIPDEREPIFALTTSDNFLRSEVINDMNEQTNNNEINRFDDMLCCVDDLGEGSFGKVSKGIDKKTGKSIIIKKILVDEKKFRALRRTQNFAYNEKINKMIKEADIVSELNHPNIIKFFGYREEEITNGSQYKQTEINIYMEDICGKSLAYNSKKLHGLPFNLISLFSKQILDAFSYIHSKKIMHMDIKGDNILLSKDGEIKLIDFGESVQLTDKTPVCVPGFIGTMIYIAPELYSSEYEINELNMGKCDIWSFGVMLIEIFVGKIYLSLNQNPSINQIINALLKNLFIKIDKIINSDKKFESKDNTADDYINIDVISVLIDLIENSGKYKDIFVYLDFVKKCLNENVAERFLSSDLLNHNFITKKLDEYIIDDTFEIFDYYQNLFVKTSENNDDNVEIQKNTNSINFELLSSFN